MRRPTPPGSPVVVKVGSSSLALPGGGVDQEGIERTAAQVAGLAAAGYRPVLVSSGAVAAGLPVLGLTARPGDVQGLQVAAAVGQGRLMERYTGAFDGHGLVVGQVLLTSDILGERRRYLRARHTLSHLLSRRVVPIVNENDTVAVDELRLGDNDRLAAIVGHLVDARILLLLTDTAGVYTADPADSGDAALLTAVTHTDTILDELFRSGGSGSLGSGGIATKIAAARMAAWSGIPTVVAEAAAPGVVAAAVAGEAVGTWIDPHPSRLPARKLWIALGVPPTGTVTVDAGAVDAIVSGGSSLLPAGVVSVAGSFAAGDAVEVVDPSGETVAKGLAGLDAHALREASGRHTSTSGGAVAVHRDDLVILR